MAQVTAFRERTVCFNFQKGSENPRQDCFRPVIQVGNRTLQYKGTASPLAGRVGGYERPHRMAVQDNIVSPDVFFIHKVIICRQCIAFNAFYSWNSFIPAISPVVKHKKVDILLKDGSYYMITGFQY